MNKNKLSQKAENNIHPGQAVKRLLLKNGSILDLETGRKNQLDLVIINGIIAEITKFEAGDFNGEILDLSDTIITPGLIDMHVHFREPGYEHKETLLSGAAAAMAGGFTSVCTMPNTTPATDNTEIITYIKEKFEEHLVDVYPIAAITKARQGKELTAMSELLAAGAKGFSDDGNPVVDSRIMRQALRNSKALGVPIIEHCEDPYLFRGGAMHEGEVSAELDIPGIPGLVEEIMVARNIMLAADTGGHLHIAHVSTAGSVELVRKAKEKAINVTCEAAPHHFSLTHEAVKTLDTNTKMNPPLRTRADLEAILNGLKDGTIDVIASDHAPHTVEEKNVPFTEAPFGIIGLETMLALTITKLVRPGILTLAEAIKKMTWEPARIMGIESPEIRVNSKANLTFINQDISWQANNVAFKSKSQNSPYNGWTLHGSAPGVFNNSRLIFNRQCLV